MKQILINVPEWVDEELVKLQMERILAIESRKREEKIKIEFVIDTNILISALIPKNSNIMSW